MKNKLCSFEYRCSDTDVRLFEPPKLVKVILREVSIDYYNTLICKKHDQ